MKCSDIPKFLIGVGFAVCKFGATIYNTVGNFLFTPVRVYVGNDSTSVELDRQTRERVDAEVASVDSQNSFSLSKLQENATYEGTYLNYDDSALGTLKETFSIEI